jgi:branched-chain amino acid transport system permease protein
MLAQIAAAVIDGILLGLVYALVGIGLGLILGILGIVNVAHGAFVMLGSFLAYELFRRLRIDPIAAFFVAMIAFFPVGLIVWRVIAGRLGQHATQSRGLLAMFGLMVLLESAGTMLWTNDSRVLTTSYADRAVAIGGVVVAQTRLLAGALALVLIGSIWAFLRFTLTGRAIRATGQDRTAASTLGIDPERLSRMVFGLGVACAGAAGAALAMVFPFSPNTQVQWLPWAFLVVILGGLANPASIAMAGLAIGLLQTLCTALLPFDYVYLVLYLLLAGILIVRREGLGGTRRTL